jgi:CRISPR/Cas system-associated protein Csx1
LSFISQKQTPKASPTPNTLNYNRNNNIKDRSKSFKIKIIDEKRRKANHDKVYNDVQLMINKLKKRDNRLNMKEHRQEYLSMVTEKKQNMT